MSWKIGQYVEDVVECFRCHTTGPKKNMVDCDVGGMFACADEKWCHQRRNDQAAILKEHSARETLVKNMAELLKQDEAMMIQAGQVLVEMKIVGKLNKETNLFEPTEPSLEEPGTSNRKGAKRKARAKRG